MLVGGKGMSRFVPVLKFRKCWRQFHLIFGEPRWVTPSHSFQTVLIFTTSKYVLTVKVYQLCLAGDDGEEGHGSFGLPTVPRMSRW